VVRGGRLSVLQPDVDRSEDHLGDQADDHQVEQHLDGHQGAGEVGLGGDVTESDGGEHGDGEIHGADLVHGFAETVGLCLPGQVVDGREDDQQQGDPADQGLKPAQPRERRVQDRPDLPGDHHPDQDQTPEQQQHPDVLRLVQWQQVVR